MALCGFKVAEADKFGTPTNSVVCLVSSLRLRAPSLDAVITGFTDRRLAQPSFDCTIGSRQDAPVYYVLAQVQLADGVGVYR